MDSSSAVLLRSSGKTPSASALDSSRYKIRNIESRKDDEDIEEPAGTYVPSPVPKAKRESKASPPTGQPQPPAQIPAPTGPAANATAPDHAQAPVSEQMRELILGG